MPTLNDAITGFVQGDSFAIHKTITNVPVGQSMIRAWFTVKEEVEDADADAIFQKVITPSSSPDGIIEDAGGGDQIGKVLFRISKEESQKLTAGRDYHFDLQIKTALNEIYTPWTGLITSSSETTLANT